MYHRGIKFATFALLLTASSAWFPCSSAFGALGNVTAVSQSGDSLTLAVGSDTIVFRAWRTNLLEVDYRPNGQGQPHTDIIGNTNGLSPETIIDTNANPIRITTAAMVVEIDRAPCRMRVFDGTGTNLLLREQAAEGVYADGVRFYTKPSQDFYGISGFYVWDDTSSKMLRNNGGYAEAGYQGDCGAPMAWTRSGFGVLVDSDGGQFTMGGTNLTFQYCSKTDILYYIAVGRPEEILSAFMDVSGHPPMLPKWAMGFANTEWGITQTELTNIVATYRQKQIPIDHYIVDFDWKAWGEDNYGEWRWNTSKFPGGPSGALKASLDASGIHLSGIMKPRVHVNTTQGSYATANGYWWPGQSTYNDYFSGQPVKDLNFALPACRAWFFDHITNSFATGIQGWWNDEADQAGGGGILFGNWQFLNMEKALYEGQRSVTSQRVWSINRNFYLGAQRYAYAMWSGDIDGGFSNMARERERMLSSINVGAVKWGMDIGGFNNGGQTTSECYARWMEFGAFVPVYRVHGQMDNQRQPWVYGSTAEAAAKAAMQLRYQLIPYIYSYERQTFENGIGIVRPLVYAFPDDAAVANYVNAWMFGDALLVSPVVTAGATNQVVYLPAGTWYNRARGTKYSGPLSVNYAVNSSTWTDIPLFVRAGAVVPTQPVMNHVGEAPVTNITVDVFPDWTPMSFTYYDDDGTTYAYESGAWFKQRMSAALENNRALFDIAAPDGSFVPEVDHFTCRIHAPTGTTVMVNDSNLLAYASLVDFTNSADEGWASGTDRYGQVTYVRVAAQQAKSIVIENNLLMPPTFSPDGGTYSGPVLLTIEPPTTDATVRLTTDGTDPDETSAVYDAPFVVWSSITVRAKAFLEGRSPSETVAATFVIDNNQLLNGGFELPGITTNDALHWDAGDPDFNGDMDGSARRVNWRSHSGAWQGTVRGTWAGAGTHGAFWQERPVLSGRTYIFSAWFWADSTWSAGQQGMKLEFLTGQPTGTNYLQASTSTFSNVGQTWVQKTMTATAPAGAEWVRVVVYAENVGANGALQFDDLRLDPSDAIPLTISSEHDSPVPPVGTHLYGLGTVVTSTVNAQEFLSGTQYICTGWTLSGNDPLSGSTNAMTMTVTNGALLTWTWITNVPPPASVELEATAYTVAETSGAVVLRAVRSGGTAGVVQVHFTTADGSAHSNSDYVASGGFLTFGDGETNVDIVVPVLDDVLFEADEDFAVTLYAPEGTATLGVQTNATVTIESDDPDLGEVTLTVYSDYDTASPPAGVNTQQYGTIVVCSVSNAVVEGTTQYVGVGWVGTGSVPEAGTSNGTAAIVLTNDSAITWLWQTDVAFSVSAGANGSVIGDAGGWYPLGTSVTVQAAPLTNYVFSGWTGDVSEAEAAANPLTLALDGAKAITALFLPAAGSNLLNNPSFEQQGASSDFAAYWKMNDPDPHGDVAGTALRVNWISHDGGWEGTVRGQWSGAGTDGVFWQEIPAHPGARYRFSGWFWADDGNPWGPWYSTRQHMALEFRSRAATGDTVIAATTNDLGIVTQTWALHSVEADAPPEADWLRVIIAVDGVGPDGALQFDELKLEALATLPKPVLLPADGTNATSFMAHWEPVAGASGYALDVATNNAFLDAQYASDLFMSEYGEGSGNNRYIEIYNGTANSVDLSAYALWGINNGGSWAESSHSLTGTIARGATYVIRNVNAAAADLVAAADASSSSAALNFTGDDAVGLARLIGSSFVLIDAVGAAGADPGSGWGVSGVNDGTFNHTLLRKPEVRAGDIDWSTCSNEWIVLASDTFTNVGEHTVSWEYGGDFLSAYQARDAGNTLSLVVTGLVPGAMYYVRLRATNDAALSPYSDVLDVITRAFFNLTASADANGAISPSGIVEIAAGSNGVFEITANTFHHIASVVTNGTEFIPDSPTNLVWVTWSNVLDDGTIEAHFAENLTSSGTPEWWLDQYYGPTNYEDASMDDGDTDGVPAWQEFIADTNPTNGASYLQLWFGDAEAGTELRFLSATGRTYGLEYESNFLDEIWFPLEGFTNLPGDGTMQTVADTNDLPLGAYRLRVSHP